MPAIRPLIPCLALVSLALASCQQLTQPATSEELGVPASASSSRSPARVAAVDNPSSPPTNLSFSIEVTPRTWTAGTPISIRLSVTNRGQEPALIWGSCRYLLYRILDHGGDLVYYEAWDIECGAIDHPPIELLPGSTLVEWGEPPPSLTPGTYRFYVDVGAYEKRHANPPETVRVVP